MSREPSIDRINNRPAEKSFGELLSQLATDSSTLVRNEIMLATRELGKKATVTGRAVAVVMVALLLALASIIFIGVAGMESLALVLPRWAAALIVAGVFLIVTSIFAVAGANRLKSLSLKPKQTIETLKEDGEWLKKLA
jgi:uncharacterized membrane protein YqjE